MGLQEKFREIASQIKPEVKDPKCWALFMYIHFKSKVMDISAYWNKNIGFVNSIDEHAPEWKQGCMYIQVYKFTLVKLWNSILKTLHKSIPYSENVYDSGPYEMEHGLMVNL